jgi:hypothetical protein
MDSICLVMSNLYKCSASKNKINNEERGEINQNVE